MIRLIGPGGAGKSTAGALLARLLALPFLDLDRAFADEHGAIDRFTAFRTGYPPWHSSVGLTGDRRD